MIRIPFNTGWTVAPRKSPYDEFITRRSEPLPAPVPVTLPHDAVRDLPRDPNSENGSHTGYFPGGNFRYSKDFDVPKDWRERTVLLEFEGVYRDAMVYINGDLAGQRPSGLTGFTVDAVPYLRYGRHNKLVVECRSHQDSRWYTGAGIYRDVWLAVADELHIELDGVKVVTEQIEDRDATIQIATTIGNAGRQTQTVRLNTQLLDKNGQNVASATTPVTLLPGTSAVARARLLIRGADLWCPDDPSLYTVVSEILDGTAQTDTDRTKFGIRTVTLDPERGLRCNGSPLKLRGACIHHDNGPLGAAAIARADERRVELLKEAGFNAIRSGHSPISRATLDAADRIGMFVIDEFTDVWTEAKNGSDYSLAFSQWWQADLEELVRKDFNHPSVLMYSIGNETFESGTPIGSVWARRLGEHLRTLDPTRPVANSISPAVAVFERLSGMLAPTSAADGAPGSSRPGGLSSMVASRMASEAIEEAAAAADVVAFNYSEARYALDADRYPNRVIVGAESLPAQIAQLWPMVCSHPHVIGDFTWTGWDYLGEAGLGRIGYPDDPDYRYNGFNDAYPALTAQTGDLDITGRRRPISYFRETVFGLRKEPYIAVQRPERHGARTQPSRWSWSDTVSSWSWHCPVGAPVAVEVYSDAEEIELLLDGRSLGRAPVGEQTACLTMFETVYQPGTLTAVAYTAGEESGRTSLTSAVGTPRLALTSDRNEIFADTSDLAFCRVALVDANGTLDTAAERELIISVSGPGVLAGLASGRPTTEEPLGGPNVTTFDGQALAVIRPTAVGTIAVTASTSGGRHAAARITVIDA